MVWGLSTGSLHPAWMGFELTGWDLVWLSAERSSPGFSRSSGLHEFRSPVCIYMVCVWDGFGSGCLRFGLHERMSDRSPVAPLLGCCCGVGCGIDAPERTEWMGG